MHLALSLQQRFPVRFARDVFAICATGAESVGSGRSVVEAQRVPQAWAYNLGPLSRIPPDFQLYLEER